MAKLALDSTVRLRTGRTIPVLGFGVYQNYTTKPSVLEALKAGYRHIDTAQGYRNEADVGTAVAESDLERKDVFITSKIISSNHGYDKTLRLVDESVAKIGGGYIDLFLIHNPNSNKALRLGTYKALLELRDAGKLKDVGVSNYGPKHLEEIREAGMEMPAVNQVELHPLCQQKPILEYCKKHDILVEAYTPLIRGKWDEPVFKEIADKHNKDIAQILIRWSLQRGFVPLPKSATPSRIRSNTNVFDFELDEDDMQKLNALDKGDAGAVTWNPIHAE